MMSFSILCKALVFLLLTAPSVRSQGRETKNSLFPLTTQVTANCTDIIANSQFFGSCCSLSDSPSSSGCTITVINGNCVITGSVLTIDYKSTDQVDSCPTSQYQVPISTSAPSAAPPSTPVPGMPHAAPSSPSAPSGGSMPTAGAGTMAYNSLYLLYLAPALVVLAWAW